MNSEDIKAEQSKRILLELWREGGGGVYYTPNSFFFDIYANYWKPTGNGYAIYREGDVELLDW